MISGYDFPWHRESEPFLLGVGLDLRRVFYFKGVAVWRADGC